MNVIYELWREIRQPRIPLISEHFPIKSKLRLFLSRQWRNPQPFLKNSIRIVTGFHPFYCLFFFEQYFTMYFIIWHLLHSFSMLCGFVFPNSAWGSQSRHLQTRVHVGVLQGESQWNMLGQVIFLRVVLTFDSSWMIYWHLLSLSFVTDEFPISRCRSVSMEKRECGGHCQHTTCSSCLVLRPPSCAQSCSSTDHVCLHRFGRCVRGHLTEEKHPSVCHQNLQVHFTSVFDVKLKYNCLFLWWFTILFLLIETKYC